jgi:hypothetical protein
VSNPLLYKAFTAGGAVAPYRIVAFSAAETVIQSAAATASHVGVSSELDVASGERIEVVTHGIAYVTAGAAITLGALVTSDATGRAVAAAPATGVNNRTIGIAMEAAAAAGDIIRVLLSPGSVQG